MRARVTPFDARKHVIAAVEDKRIGDPRAGAEVLGGLDGDSRSAALTADADVDHLAVPGHTDDVMRLEAVAAARPVRSSLVDKELPGRPHMVVALHFDVIGRYEVEPDRVGRIASRVSRFVGLRHDNRLRAQRQWERAAGG